MLSAVKVPVLFTHHFWTIDEATGSLVRRTLRRAGGSGPRADRGGRAAVELPVVPAMGHSMHGQDPELFATTLGEWASTLG